MSNNNNKIKSTCIHCKVSIVHYDGRLWHDGSLIFPQYCRRDNLSGGELLKSVHEEGLHEPLPEDLLKIRQDI